MFLHLNGRGSHLQDQIEPDHHVSLVLRFIYNFLYFSHFVRQLDSIFSLFHLVIFTVMCYNVLCDKYATRQMYGYCPSWALTWEYRKKVSQRHTRTICQSNRIAFCRRYWMRSATIPQTSSACRRLKPINFITSSNRS